MAAPTRPPSYPELLVGPCKVQTATDRFGSRAPAIVRRRDTAWALHLPNDIEDSDVIVPKMQRWGMNLTALSQRYNLYFAAYEHRIAVYRPRSVPRQSLPSMPDLVLIPDPTDAASWVQGHPSRDSPHQANHIIVGQLGYEEVLVAAYDDGDNPANDCLVQRPDRPRLANGQIQVTPILHSALVKAIQTCTMVGAAKAGSLGGVPAGPGLCAAICRHGRLRNRLADRSRYRVGDFGAGRMVGLQEDLLLALPDRAAQQQGGARGVRRGSGDARAEHRRGLRLGQLHLQTEGRESQQELHDALHPAKTRSARSRGRTWSACALPTSPSIAG